jgi:hypothetical protein
MGYLNITRQCLNKILNNTWLTILLTILVEFILCSNFSFNFNLNNEHLFTEMGVSNTIKDIHQNAKRWEEYHCPI